MISIIKRIKKLETLKQKLMKLKRTLQRKQLPQQRKQPHLKIENLNLAITLNTIIMVIFSGQPTLMVNLNGKTIEIIKFLMRKMLMF